MTKTSLHLIIAFTATISITACSDSGISEASNSSIIGAWRKIDTNTVSITDTLGNFVGISHRTVTVDLAFNENATCISTTKYEYSPQYEYPNIVEKVIEGPMVTLAKDSISTKSKTWKLSADTIKFTDTLKIYTSDSTGSYRSYATGYSVLYSISNNVLTLKSLIEQLKADAPPTTTYYQRIM